MGSEWAVNELMKDSKREYPSLIHPAQEPLKHSK